MPARKREATSLTPTPARPASVGAAGEDPQLLPDLFHALNQPITALRCGLELSLHRPRTLEQYREALQAGLQQSQQIALWAIAIRELLQADDPGDDRQTLEMDAFLREAVTDLQPVAESLALKVAFARDFSAQVWFEAGRLRQALFRLIEFALGESCRGAVLTVDARQQDGKIVILLASAQADIPARKGQARPKTKPTEQAASERVTSKPATSQRTPAEHAQAERTQALRRRLSLAIPSRIVAAAGGSLRSCGHRGRLRLELCLPLAPVAAPLMRPAPAGE